MSDFIESFQKVLTKDNIELYIGGLKNTLLISAIALVVGAVVGVILAMINYLSKKTGKFKFFSVLANIYITIIRGTPVVLQLLFVYFVIFISTPVPKPIAGALAFGLNSSAYVAEIIRAGFESVDDGQREAGRSLGLSTGRTLWHIIIPQAIKNSLPPLFNEFITLIKETAIIGYIAVEDLSMVSESIGAATFNYIAPLVFSACIYLGIVMLLTLALKRIEKVLAKSDRNGGKK